MFLRTIGLLSGISILNRVNKANDIRTNWTTSSASCQDQFSKSVALTENYWTQLSLKPVARLAFKFKGIRLCQIVRDIPSCQQRTVHETSALTSFEKFLSNSKNSGLFPPKLQPDDVMATRKLPVANTNIIVFITGRIPAPWRASIVGPQSFVK